jgi:hypothetical protein
MRAIVARETPLLIPAGRARITAAAHRPPIARVMRVRATRSTRKVRLAIIRTGRRPRIKAAHTINAAQLHRVLILPRLNSAAIRRRSSEATLRRVARTRRRHTLRRLLAAHHQEEDILRVATVVEIEADRDHTAAKQKSD